MPCHAMPCHAPPCHALHAHPSPTPPQANYNMDSDAASQAASSAAKSLDEKSSVASDVPLIPERTWIRTHAYIQGLTMALLVRAAAASATIGFYRIELVWIG
jgi:hypothetical protein